MMRSWRYAVLCTVLAGLDYRLAAAQSNMTGIDLVMMIDHSGSMWGNPSAHPVANDPWVHRVGVAQDIVLRLAEHARDTAMVHRVSVIDFGSDTKTALSAYRLEHDKARPAALLRDTKLVVESAIRPQRGRYTNTPEALRDALTEFALMQRQAPFDGRRSIALLITDGRPTTGDNTNELWPSVREAVKNLDSLGAELWVIGINDSADNFWRRSDGSIWDELAGAGRNRARLATPTSSGMAHIVNDYVGEWFGGDHGKEVAPGAFLCPPYLRKITFRVTFQKQRSDIRIFDSEGVLLEQIGGDANSDPGTFAVFTHENPPPGSYTIQTDATEGYVIYHDLLPPNVERLTVAEAPQGQDVELRFRLSTNLRSPIDVADDWPLDVQARVRRVGVAVDQSVPLTYAGNGTFEGNWQAADHGRFETALHVVALMPNGERVPLIDDVSTDEWYPLEITERHPYVLHLEQPALDGVAGVAPWGAGLPVEVFVVDSGGKRVDPLSSIIDNPNSFLMLTLLTGAGLSANQESAMKPTADSSFSGTIPLRFDWIAGEGWIRAKRVFFAVRPGAELSIEDGYLTALASPAGVQSQHVGGDVFSVGPIEAMYPFYLQASFWTGSGIALVSALAGFIGGIVRVAQVLLIRLDDRKQGKTLNLLVYDKENDPDCSFGKRFPVRSRKVNLDKRFSLDLDDGSKKTLSELRVTRHVLSMPRSVRVKYKWSAGAKDSHSETIQDAQMKAVKGVPDEVSLTFRLEYGRGATGS